MTDSPPPRLVRPATRVVLVSTNADLAGAPLHVRTIALELVARGVGVTVVFGQEGPVEADLRAHGVACEVLPTMRSDLRFWRDRATLDGLVRILRAARPDLVHAHSAKAGQLARRAAARIGVPCVYTVHGWGFGPGRPWLQATLLGVVERTLVRATTQYIAVSNADASAGRVRLGIAPQAITTVHNGVADSPLRARPETSNVVVMVSRVHKGKDHATLFRATDALDCEVWCIGGGTDTDAFREAAARVRSDGGRRVRFLGTRTDVAELLAQSAVSVLSSRYEGLPLSIIEAMRAGLPVVATDVGGVGELVRPGQNGELFRVGDVAALRVHLGRLLADGGLRRRLGETARRDYERGFTLDAMMHATIDIYQRALFARLVPTAAAEAGREPAAPRRREPVASAALADVTEP